MAIPLLPWEPHVFPTEIQTELRRRAINRGLNPVNSFNIDWKDDGDWNSYRGPMTSWVRFCSNGIGLEAPDDRPVLPGFIMYGGKDFYTAYGFNLGVQNHPGGKLSTQNTSVIGYTPNGIAHVIENDLNSNYPIHVPPPEVERVSATIQKELLRRARIEWTCFSFKQLEYMTPYFLVPGITCILEWGWNHFNPLSLLDLTNESRLQEYFNDPYPLYTENILDSKGNYEVLFGTVTNFEWSIEGNKIKCVTEVTSKDRLYAGVQIRGNLAKSDVGLTKTDPNDNTTQNKPRGSDDPNANESQFLDTFKQWITDYVDKFKDLPEEDKTADQILDPYLNQVQEDKRGIGNLIRFIKERHPDNYKEYVFGIYYGRDEKTVPRQVSGGFGPSQTVQVKSFSDEAANKDKDFDAASPRSELWLNMGLVVEILNYHGCGYLKGVKDKPLFIVDVDDCVISAHPNLISTNGEVLLIPNAIAPKCHYGVYGHAKVKASDDWTKQMEPASYPNIPVVKASDLEQIKNSTDPTLKWANYRMRRVLGQWRPKRDDINELINVHRYQYADSQGKYMFPFLVEYNVAEGGDIRTYDAWYTGFFKNLYLNVKVLKNLVGETDKIVTFKDLMEAIFDKINSAAAGFWKFRLDGGAGRLNSKGYAPMKVVDENLTQLTSNVGDIFTFDYNAADGLIQNLSFRPTLSNAQAIRTIYAQTNLTNKQKVVMSGYNELLDYKFRDRLFTKADASSNKTEPSAFRNTSYIESISRLQSVDPLDGVYQVTTKKGGSEIIFRLALPPSHEDILSLLLDDNDKGHNPRYTGIMPGIQAELTIQGIAGIRTFAMFRVRGLPEPYSERNIVFRVVNCNDSVQNGQWTTQIVAGILPLRGYFCSKLGLPPTEAKE